MPDLYYSERNLLRAASEGKHITEAEIRVLTDRLTRTRHSLAEVRETVDNAYRRLSNTTPGQRDYWVRGTLDLLREATRREREETHA